MPIYQLSENIIFPEVNEAEDGLLAIGGDLSVERLTLAYQSGIFPWFSSDQPILWWSPDPRFVLFPKELKISKSMRSLLRKESFKITKNHAFSEVISNCKNVSRRDQEGTWITPEMKEAYIALHHLGLAISYEVWDENENLVGGLYGIQLGKVFCGESMFANVSNASKYAFIKFVQEFEKSGGLLIDCQVHTKHLESLGARNISRKDFMDILNSSK